MASREACKALKKEADEVVCLTTPEPFYAVTQAYRNFEQVADEEACRAVPPNEEAISTDRR